MPAGVMCSTLQYTNPRPLVPLKCNLVGGGIALLLIFLYEGYPLRRVVLYVLSGHEV